MIEQLDFYWDVHLRPRLNGLTDEEYLWEPVADCWSLRPGPGGRLVLDADGPQRFTTIAWRLLHVGIGCFSTRASTFFGDGSVPADADMFDPRHEPKELPGTAEEALAFLDRAYRWWHDGICALDELELNSPLGPKGNQFADQPMIALIAHVNREVMHHGGEICLLRDLYAATTH
jgi:hypothetical protein